MLFPDRRIRLGGLVRQLKGAVTRVTEIQQTNVTVL